MLSLARYKAHSSSCDLCKIYTYLPADGATVYWRRFLGCICQERDTTEPLFAARWRRHSATAERGGTEVKSGAEVLLWECGYRAGFHSQRLFGTVVPVKWAWKAGVVHSEPLTDCWMGQRRGPRREEAGSSPWVYAPGRVGRVGASMAAGAYVHGLSDCSCHGPSLTMLLS